MNRICSRTPKDAKDMANQIFYTAYLATKNSSKATQQRAEGLAAEIGANHQTIGLCVRVCVFVYLYRCTSMCCFISVCVENRRIWQPKTRQKSIFFCESVSINTICVLVFATL